MNNGEIVETWAKYREDPEGFAHDVLGSKWWSAQREVATTLSESRRVAVKAANGVGKTFLAADLLIWFLYTHEGSVVITTAPTWRQVESLLWEEVRRRHRAACYRAERNGTAPLNGKLLQTQLKITDGWFGMGLSTDEPVRFQGFHADNLLVILDEACGIDAEIWDAVEGICVGRNNRVLALSNPLGTDSRFYQLFSNSGWRTLTISALAHPNVTGESGEFPIPGAVTREAIDDRVAQWCDFVSNVSDEKPSEDSSETETEPYDPKTLVWNGKRYLPNALFRARVLGEFSESSENSLLSRDWIAEAQARNAHSASELPCALAVDVARFGSDETAIALRRGDRIVWVRTYRGQDTMVTAQRVAEVARAERCDFVLIDETGVGGGPYDRLVEWGTRGLVGVHFGGKAQGLTSDRYVNLKAQLFWKLRDALRDNTLALPDDPALADQLAGLRYDTDLSGKICMERKEEMKKRGLNSPDRADAVAMLMHPVLEPGARLALAVSSSAWRPTVNW